MSSDRDRKPTAEGGSSIYRILQRGDWGAADVVTQWEASTWNASTEDLAKIDARWRAGQATAGRSLFDGPMCRLESAAFSPTRVSLGLSVTSYKVFWGTNLAGPSVREPFDAAAMANPVGVSTLVQTSDRWLLLGRRNDRVAYYPGRVHPFAGTLEPADADPRSVSLHSLPSPASELLSSMGGEQRTQAPQVATPGPCPFNAARRELNEELRLDSSELADLRLIGVVEDARLRQPELVMVARTRLSRERLQDRLDPAEHADWVALAADPAAVVGAVHRADLTPVAAAALSLWSARESDAEGEMR